MLNVIFLILLFSTTLIMWILGFLFYKRIRSKARKRFSRNLSNGIVVGIATGTIVIILDRSIDSLFSMIMNANAFFINLFYALFGLGNLFFGITFLLYLTIKAN